ncbi:MAG TPA: hypothetical protein DGT21_05380, partial [Armatimonadetes bacterium]|nr:hypothetical protein [Armatimonadota bacterium]
MQVHVDVLEAPRSRFSETGSIEDLEYSQTFQDLVETISDKVAAQSLVLAPGSVVPGDTPSRASIGQSVKRFWQVWQSLPYQPGPGLVAGAVVGAMVGGWVGAAVGITIGGAIDAVVFVYSFTERYMQTAVGVLSSASIHSNTVGSYDPNCKQGPSGFGPSRFVSAGVPISYTVEFENDPDKALAAAYRIQISDQLDASLDWKTCRITAIRIADTDIPVPANSGALTTAVHTVVSLKDLNDPAFPDCAPQPTAVRIHVACEFDEATGLMEWTFEGRDPVTGELIDFLPPDVSEDDHRTPWNDAVAPQGGGWVTYSVQPRGDVPTGTVIRNAASITFDANEPIVTDTVALTVDSGAPASCLGALPASVSETFTVRWWAEDDEGGSGIANHDIYVSKDGGPYERWLVRTTETSAQFLGEMNSTYRFYSVARDSVGNAEATPESQEAHTTVGIPTFVTTLPDGLQMVSVPLAPRDPDPAALGFQAGCWARWNPHTQQYVHYSSDPEHYTWFTPAETAIGKGYWGRFGQDARVTAAGVAADDGAEYVLSIDPGPNGGWVQIGCPRATAVPWVTHGTGALRVRGGGQELALAEAAAAGWCEDYAWGYAPGAGYQLVRDASVHPAPGIDSLSPWQGYWMEFHRPCELVFPTVADAAAATRNREPARRARDGWTVLLKATAATGAVSQAVVGKAEHTRQAAAPPPFVEYVRLTIVGEEEPLGMDLREAGAGSSWALDVATDLSDTEITLSWPDLSALPLNNRPVLTDTLSGETRYMRTSDSYAFISSTGGECRRFRLEMAPLGAYTAALAGVTAAQTTGGQIDVRV